MPDSVVQGRAVPSPRHTLEDVPRRTIEDLTALYQLHPKLADFYVEGRTDRLFLEYLFEEADAKVIEIEEVEMPYDALQTRGLTEGNRQRVITLAANLHDAFIDEGLVSTRCIIDADFDRALGRDSGDNRFLRRTDYSCVESYWFDRYHLDKYIRFGLRQVQGLADRDISADLSPVLRSLFVLRAAGMAIRKDLTWLSPIRSLDWTEERIVFDRLRFVERWLNRLFASGWSQCPVAHVG
jgi:hypothetical protein